MSNTRTLNDHRPQSATSMIRLGQLLKLASLVEDGVEAAELIKNGLVKVNGEIEDRRGRQLHDGDTVTVNGQTVRISRPPALRPARPAHVTSRGPRSAAVSCHMLKALSTSCGEELRHVRHFLWLMPCHMPVYSTLVSLACCAASASCTPSMSSVITGSGWSRPQKNGSTVRPVRRRRRRGPLRRRRQSLTARRRRRSLRAGAGAARWPWHMPMREAQQRDARWLAPDGVDPGRQVRRERLDAVQRVGNVRAQRKPGVARAGPLGAADGGHGEVGRQHARPG